MINAPNTKQAIHQLLDEIIELSGEETYSSPKINIKDTHNLLDHLKNDVIATGYESAEFSDDTQISMPTGAIPDSTIIKGNTLINLLERHVGVRHDVQTTEIPNITTTDYGVKIEFQPSWNFNKTFFIIGGNRLSYKIKSGTQYTFSIEANLENLESFKGKLHVGTLDGATDMIVPIDVTIKEGQNRFTISSLGVLGENKVDTYMYIDNIVLTVTDSQIYRQSITLGNPMMIEGNHSNHYIKYIDGMESVAQNGSINILTIGRNFLDEKKIVTNVSFKGYYWHSGISPLKIIPNKRYLLINGDKVRNVYVIYYNRDMDIIKEEETNEIITPTSCVYIKIFGSTKPNNVMLEMTDGEPTKHVRYKSINKSIHTEPLNCINEKYCDELLTIDRVPYKEKMVGELVLGERTVYLEYCPGYDKPKTKLFRCKVNDMLPFTSENAFTFKCDKIKIGKKDMDDRATISGDPNNPQYIYVRIESMFINNEPEDINVYFESNKTKILYPLAETQYIPLDFNNDIELYLRQGMNTIFFLDSVTPKIISDYPITTNSLIQEISDKSKYIPSTGEHLFTRNLFKYDCTISHYYDSTNNYLDSIGKIDSIRDYCYETLDRSGIYRLSLFDILSEKSIGANLNLGFNKASLTNDNMITIGTKGSNVEITKDSMKVSGDMLPLGSVVSQLNAIYTDDTVVLGAGNKRPIPTKAGSWFFDTTINIPIWWNGRTWIDIEGTER